MDVVAPAHAFDFWCHSGPAATAEKSDSLRHYFGDIPLVTALVIIASRANAAFDKNLPSFCQVLAARFTLLAPDDDIMPFGSLLLVTVAVIPHLGSRDRETSYRAAGRSEAKLRIFTQITDKNYFVNRHGTSRPLQLGSKQSSQLSAGIPYSQQ